MKFSNGLPSTKIKSARNPLPEYIDQVAKWLAKDYHVISIADLEKGKEWLVEPEPYCDEKYHCGELTMVEMFALCQNANAIVGGIGWILPFAVNTNTPTFIICGGNGGYNNPANVINNTVNTTNLKFVVPDHFCLCTNNTHKCNKKISNLKEKFNEWKPLLR